MEFLCPYCETDFANKYTLNRHLDRKHGSQDIESDKNEEENSESEEEEDDTEKSCSSESESEADEGDDSDTFTYDEVRAILRYESLSSK